MKRLLLLIIPLISISSLAQVKDISFTLSPSGEYTWWDDKAGIEDGLLYGGKLGFAFGQTLELRGLYFVSNDLKTNFADYNFANYDRANLEGRAIDITRYGGELKANLSNKGLAPYLTFATGVQQLEVEGGEKYEQIFAGLGLGFKLRLSDRINLTVEGKNTIYNFNSASNFLNASEKLALGVTEADLERRRLYNWSAQASLQFYLGGSNPDEITDLDRAYMNQFKGGFSGVRWIIEPSMAHISFDDSSAFRDSYFLGGYAGLDFNEYTGIRAFYFQSSSEDKLEFDFQPLQMYGLEFRARLNDGNGVVPFLTLGGGYLDVLDGYNDNQTVQAESSEFASAGLGLNIPLGKNILITGGAKYLLTSGSDVENLQSPEAIQSHFMYNAGLKFAFGSSAEDPNEIYKSNLNEAVSTQKEEDLKILEERLAAKEKANQNRLDELKSQYANRIDSLKTELDQAYKERDTEKAVTLLEEKKKAEDDLKEVEKVDGQNKAATQSEDKESKPNQEELIKMSPEQFQELLNQILNNLENRNGNYNYNRSQQPNQYQQANPYQQQQQQAPIYLPAPRSGQDNGVNQERLDFLQKRMERLEDLLIEMNRTNVQKSNATGATRSLPSPDEDSVASVKKKDEYSELILNRLEDLNNKIDLNSRKIDQVGSNDSNGNGTVVVNPGATSTDGQTKVISVDENGNTTSSATGSNTSNNITNGQFIKNERPSVMTSALTYKGTSLYTGFNIGQQETWNIGLRMNYGFQNSNIELMNELFIAPSDPISYGLSVNAILPFSLNEQNSIGTYGGVGGGFIVNDSEFKGVYNFLIGTYLNLANGRVFVDYTTRNLFKYNQIAIGYRLAF